MEATRTVALGAPMNWAADDLAAELGISNDVGAIYEFDTVRSTAPTGVEVDWNVTRGTAQSVGMYTLKLFYAQGGVYYQQTDYQVAVAVTLTPGPESAPVAPETVAKFLGRPGDPQVIAAATEHLRVVGTFVRGYVRGNGFRRVGDQWWPDADLADVIVSATARYVVNPQQNAREQIGSQSITYARLEGFTLAEQAVLHLYRKRAG